MGWRCWRREREHDRDRERTRGLQLVENWGVAVARRPVDWLSENATTYWHGVCYSDRRVFAVPLAPHAATNFTAEIGQVDRRVVSMEEGEKSGRRKSLL